jgi:hypothetical protein
LESAESAGEVPRERRKTRAQTRKEEEEEEQKRRMEEADKPRDREPRPPRLTDSAAKDVGKCLSRKARHIKGLIALSGNARKDTRDEQSKRMEKLERLLNSNDVLRVRRGIRAWQAIVPCTRRELDALRGFSKSLLLEIADVDADARELLLCRGCLSWEGDDDDEESEDDAAATTPDETSGQTTTRTSTGDASSSMEMEEEDAAGLARKRKRPETSTTSPGGGCVGSSTSSEETKPPPRKRIERRTLSSSGEDDDNTDRTNGEKPGKTERSRPGETTEEGAEEEKEKTRTQQRR